MQIGIGITTRNRREVLEDSFKNWNKYLPKNSKIVVVDDNSDVAYKYSDYYFKKNVGISKAKNKCLELLQDCDYIFLADDDVYPKTYDWYIPYVNSGLNHLCVSFETNDKGQRFAHDVFVKEQIGDYNIFNKGNGCLLFITNKVLKEVGGFREDFVMWGNEHVEYSNRIFNKGLVEHPFVDYKHSLRLFHIKDYYGDVESSVPNDKKSSYMSENTKTLEKYIKSKDYVEYRSGC